MSPRVAGPLLVAFAAAAVPGRFLPALFAASSIVWLACLGRPARAWLVLVVAVLLRVPFAFPSYVSDDVHRYVWEGRVQLAGHDPYQRAPDDPALAHLRGSDHDAINHPSYPSIYPPLAQALFTGAAWAGLGVHGLRALLLALDAGVVALLLAWLRATGRPPGWAILYAWAPVAVISPGLGHVDPLMLLFLVGAAWAWEARRPYRAAALLAAASLAKFAAVLLLPWLAWRRPRAVLFAFVPVVALAYVPFWSPAAFATLYAFGADFAFNGSLHRVAAWLAPEHARVLVAALLSLWVVFVVATQPRVATAGVLLLAGLLVCSPTVHHWYLTWFLVLLPAAGPRRWTWPLLLWCVTVGLSGETYRAHHVDGAPFRERFALTAVAYALPAALALWLLWRGRPRRVPLAPAAPAPPPGTFAVVVPAYGEAESLRALLPRWMDAGAARVVVADTPTGDGTEALAAATGAVYVPVPRRGYGAAVQAGFDAAGEVDFLVVCDADHGRGPDQVRALLAPFADPDVALVAAARVDTRLTWPQRAGTWLAVVLIGLGWGRRFRDLGPFRALRRRAWPAGALRDPGFGWNVEMNVRALELGLGVVEVPLPGSEREHGRGAISSTLAGVVGAGCGMLGRLYRLREESCTRPSSS